MRPPNLSEEAICRAFVIALQQLQDYNQIINLESFCFFHIPNGQRAGKDSKARAIAGAKDKAQGAMRGVPDYCFMWRDINGTPFVGYLEAKTRMGTVTDEQDSFMRFCHKEKIPFAIFRSVEQGLKILQGWGVIKEGAIL